MSNDDSPEGVAPSGWGGARPGAGRPRKPADGYGVRYDLKPVSVTLTMPTETMRQIEQLATANGQEPIIVIRNAIWEYLAEHGAIPDGGE